MVKKSARTLEEYAAEAEREDGELRLRLRSITEASLRARLEQLGSGPIAYEAWAEELPQKPPLIKGAAPAYQVKLHLPATLEPSIAQRLYQDLRQAAILNPYVMLLREEGEPWRIAVTDPRMLVGYLSEACHVTVDTATGNVSAAEVKANSPAPPPAAVPAEPAEEEDYPTQLKPLLRDLLRARLRQLGAGKEIDGLLVDYAPSKPPQYRVMVHLPEGLSPSIAARLRQDIIQAHRPFPYLKDFYVDQKQPGLVIVARDADTLTHQLFAACQMAFDSDKGELVPLPLTLHDAREATIKAGAKQVGTAAASQASAAENHTLHNWQALLARAGGQEFDAEGHKERLHRIINPPVEPPPVAAGLIDKALHEGLREAHRPPTQLDYAVMGETRPRYRELHPQREIGAILRADRRFRGAYRGLSEQVYVYFAFVLHPRPPGALGR